MDSFDWVSGANWAAAVIVLAVFAYAAARRVWAKQDDEAAKREQRREDYAAARKSYLEAMNAGDSASARKWKSQMDALARLGFVLALAVSVCGCRSRAPSTIWLTDYARTISAGETVPPLPDGESRWWLLSAPTGIEAMIPEVAR